MNITPEEGDGKLESILKVEVGSMEEGNTKNMFTKDEYQLATLGYKQEFFRSLGLSENWSVIVG